MSETGAALRGRIGGYAQKARHDPKETTAEARRTFLASFEHEVDPQRVLPEAERARRATAARKAYFARLAYKSAQVRSARKKARDKGAS